MRPWRRIKGFAPELSDELDGSVEVIVWVERVVPLADETDSVRVKGMVLYLVAPDRGLILESNGKYMMASFRSTELGVSAAR